MILTCKPQKAMMAGNDSGLQRLRRVARTFRYDAKTGLARLVAAADADGVDWQVTQHVELCTCMADGIGAGYQ